MEAANKVMARSKNTELDMKDARHWKEKWDDKAGEEPRSWEISSSTVTIEAFHI